MASLVPSDDDEPEKPDSEIPNQLLADLNQAEQGEAPDWRSVLGIGAAADAGEIRGVEIESTFRSALPLKSRKLAFGLERKEDEATEERPEKNRSSLGPLESMSKDITYRPKR